MAVGSVVFAQAPSASDVPVIRVETDLIEVPVMALKAPSLPALGLTSKDFSILLDGGPPFHPRHVRVENNEPLNLNLLVIVDADDALLLPNALARAFLASPSDMLGPQDPLSVYLYGCQLIHPLDNVASALKANRNALLHSVSAEAFDAASVKDLETCPRHSTQEILSSVIDTVGANNSARWKVLLLLINDERTMPSAFREEIVERAAEGGITLLTVRLLPPGNREASIFSDKNEMSLLSGSLGGILMPTTPEDIGTVFDELITDLRARYVLSFPRPSNGTQGIHTLKISTSANHVRVFAAAVAAPLLDSVDCARADVVCTTDRPRYGDAPAPPR